MNYYRLMSRFLNKRNVQQLTKMFRRKKSKGGMMWASLLGIAMSALALGFKQNPNNKNDHKGGTIQNMLGGMNFNKLLQGKPNMGTMVEFAKEITPNRSQTKKNEATAQFAKELMAKNDQLQAAANNPEALESVADDIAANAIQTFNKD